MSMESTQISACIWVSWGTIWMNGLNLEEWLWLASGGMLRVQASWRFTIWTNGTDVWMSLCDSSLRSWWLSHCPNQWPFFSLCIIRTYWLHLTWSSLLPPRNPLLASMTPHSPGSSYFPNCFFLVFSLGFFSSAPFLGSSSISWFHYRLSAEDFPIFTSNSPSPLNCRMR